MQKNVDAMVQALVTDPRGSEPRWRRRPSSRSRELTRRGATAGACSPTSRSPSRRGSIHLLVGPNGAGKSTLLAAVLGQIEFTGSIRFHWRGAGPHRLRAAELRRRPHAAGHRRRVPRAVAPAPAGLPRHRPRDARRRIDALLARVGLAGFWRRPLGALSGGELQRVLLANAIDPAPELLLLDEPASGLDETAVRQLEERRSSR